MVRGAGGGERWRGGMAAAAVALAAGAARGQAFIENFEGGTNVGGWTIVGGPGGASQGSGGNPGQYYGGVNFNYPDIQSRGHSPFMGDYIARQVGALGIDLVTFSHQGAVFPLTLMLVCDSGTPADPGDDWGAYFTGSANVPNTGEGWRRYSFSINPNAAGTPAGWTMIDVGGNPPPVRDWPTLMRSVGQVRFLFAPPGTLGNFPVWNIGLDNVVVTEYPPCYANCDGSTGAPMLNVNDFTCFLNRYAAGETYANCDASITPPVLNIDDFMCFMVKYAGGCP